MGLSSYKQVVAPEQGPLIRLLEVLPNPGFCCELEPQKVRLARVRKRVMTFSDLAGDKNRSGCLPGRWIFITLTYAKIEDWQGKHISVYLNHLRDWAARRQTKIGYVWVAELQERGAVHYHLACKVERQFTLPKPDKAGWWVHGWSRIERVEKTVRNYLSKYLSKQGEGVFPAGCRLTGQGGLPPDGRAWARFQARPAYVREECNPADYPKRCRGGHTYSGALPLPTPWAGRRLVNGNVALYRYSIDERARNWWYWRMQDVIDTANHKGEQLNMISFDLADLTADDAEFRKLAMDCGFLS